MKAQKQESGHVDMLICPILMAPVLASSMLFQTPSNLFMPSRDGTGQAFHEEDSDCPHSSRDPPAGGA